MFVVGGHKDIVDSVAKAYLEQDKDFLLIVMTNRIEGKSQDVAYKTLLENHPKMKVVFLGVAQEESIGERVRCMGIPDGGDLGEFVLEKVLSQYPGH